jgi:UDP-4-amino-4,6-dideoxy-N-acetyl-beta-L-altrosamine transaminase
LIPYGKQQISEEDVTSVVNVLNSDFLTQGPVVPIFEEAVQQLVGAKYGIATNSATSALHIACMSLEVNQEDYIWTSAITFVASANCALYCGAKIDFVDINHKTYNMCAEALNVKLKIAKKNGTLPKVVIVVHFSGQSCEMKKISELSHQYGFKIIEDASHAIGGKYDHQYVGNCKYSEITVFSFHPVKIVTTAEGGMAMTNNPSLAKKMRLYRNHGITRDNDLMTNVPDGPWYYQQICLGYNYRMTDIHAALGVSQLKRITSFIKLRSEIFFFYNEEFKKLEIQTPFQHKDTFSSFHLYVIRLNLNKIRYTHLEIFNKLREKGIGVNIHYIPVHLQPYFRKLGFKQGDFPEAEKYYKEAISLPIYHGLKKDQRQEVISVIKSLLE